MKKYFLLAALSFVFAGNNFAQLQSTQQSEIKDNEIFEYADIMPEFPGGVSALQMYLKNNLNYPKDAKDSKITDKVVTQFVIDKNGKVVNAKIIRSANYSSLDKESLRVINAMPYWTPGKIDNKTVAVRMQLPILFQLN